MLEARLASPIFTIVVRRSGRRSPSRPLSAGRSPSRAIPPFRRAEPTTPADQTGARVDCFPAHAAFPKWQEGRQRAERNPPPPIGPERKPPPPIPPPRKPPPPKPPPWKPPPPPPWPPPPPPPKPPRAKARFGASMPTEATANKATTVLRNMTVLPLLIAPESYDAFGAITVANFRTGLECLSDNFAQFSATDVGLYASPAAPANAL